MLLYTYQYIIILTSYNIQLYTHRYSLPFESIFFKYLTADTKLNLVRRYPLLFYDCEKAQTKSVIL